MSCIHVFSVQDINMKSFLSLIHWLTQSPHQAHQEPLYQLSPIVPKDKLSTLWASSNHSSPCVCVCVCCWKNSCIYHCIKYFWLLIFLNHSCICVNLITTILGVGYVCVWGRGGCLSKIMSLREKRWDDLPQIIWEHLWECVSKMDSPLH